MSPQAPLLKRQDCLLLLIDLQERLLPVIAGNEEILANAVRLAKFAGIIGLPVLVSEQQKLGPTVAELAQALPAGEPPLTKVTFDCLADQGLAQALAKAGRSTIIMAGIEAHICVAQTALSAMGQHQVQVVADAVGSRNPRNLELALERLRRAGAEITSTEMVIYELLGKAGTEEFKATLPLVK